MILPIVLGAVSGIITIFLVNFIITRIRISTDRTAVLIDIDSQGKVFSRMLSCPFCGKECADIVNLGTDDEPNYVVLCQPKLGGCGSMTSIYDDPYFAVRHWNTRDGIVKSKFLSEDEFNAS